MEINSLQDYLNIISVLSSNNFISSVPTKNPLIPHYSIPPKLIFRGHSNYKDYKLTPAVFRWTRINDSKYVGDFSQAEHNILYDFISEACRYIQSVPTDDVVSWLEIAQHFGVPTRLLDFTNNPLVALYFACSGSPKQEAAVYVINETVYNAIVYNKPSFLTPAESRANVEKIVFDEIVQQNYTLHSDPNVYLQYPHIYKPYYRQERMNSQGSVFMIWGANRSDLFGMFPLEKYDMIHSPREDSCSGGMMAVITIPAETKGALLKQLDHCGINEKFIYPGIEGIGRYIRKKYSSKQ